MEYECEFMCTIHCAAGKVPKSETRQYIITGIINVCKITLKVLKLKTSEKNVKIRNTTTKKAKGTKEKKGVKNDKTKKNS